MGIRLEPVDYDPFAGTDTQVPAPEMGSESQPGGGNAPTGYRLEPVDFDPFATDSPAAGPSRKPASATPSLGVRAAGFMERATSPEMSRLIPKAVEPLTERYVRGLKRISEKTGLGQWMRDATESMQVLSADPEASRAAFDLAYGGARDYVPLEAESLARGFQQTASSIPRLFQMFANRIPAGNEKLGTTLFEGAADNLQASANAIPPGPKLTDPGGWKNPRVYTTGVAEAVPSYAAMLAGYALGGRPGGAIAGGLLEAAGYYDELQQDGVPEQEAFARSMVYGAVSSKLNDIGLGKMLDVGVVDGLKQRVLKTLGGMGWEGATEYGEEVYTSFDKFANTYINEGRLDWDGLKTDLVQGLNVIPGAAGLGGAINVGSQVLNTTRTRRQERAGLRALGMTESEINRMPRAERSKAYEERFVPMQQELLAAIDEAMKAEAARPRNLITGEPLEGPVRPGGAVIEGLETTGTPEVPAPSPPPSPAPSPPPVPPRTFTEAVRTLEQDPQVGAPVPQDTGPPQLEVIGDAEAAGVGSTPPATPAQGEIENGADVTTGEVTGGEVPPIHQMTYEQLRTALESQEDRRDLLRTIFPEYTEKERGAVNWANDFEAGIWREANLGDERARVPMVDLSQRHRRLIQSATDRGETIPDAVLADYPDLALPPGAPVGPNPDAAPSAVAPPAVEGASPAATPAQPGAANPVIEAEKQPWEMTRGEFELTRNTPIVNGIQEAIRAGKPIQVGTQYRVTPLTKPEHIRVRQDGTVQTREGKKWVALPQALVDSLAAQAGMEVPDFRNRVYHRREVIEAIRQGKPVPESVLAEYPNIQEIMDDEVEDQAEEVRQKDAEGQGETAAVSAGAGTEPGVLGGSPETGVPASAGMTAQGTSNLGQDAQGTSTLSAAAILRMKGPELRRRLTEAGLSAKGSVAAMKQRLLRAQSAQKKKGAPRKRSTKPKAVNNPLRNFRITMRDAGIQPLDTLTFEDFGGRFPPGIIRKGGKYTWNQAIQEAQDLGLITDENPDPSALRALFLGSAERATPQSLESDLEARAETEASDPEAQLRSIKRGSNREINEAEVVVGDLVYKDGEWYQAVESDADGLTLEDGARIEVGKFDSFTARGVIGKDSDLYAYALEEYREQEAERSKEKKSTVPEVTPATAAASEPAVPVESAGQEEMFGQGVYPLSEGARQAVDLYGGETQALEALRRQRDVLRQEGRGTAAVDPVIDELERRGDPMAREAMVYYREQLELFDLEEANNGDTAQALADAAAAQRRAVSRAAGTPAVRTIGSRISATVADELARRGYVDILDRSFSTPGELAGILQVFRDPRFETFRFIFTRNGKIVSHEAITAKVPSATPVYPEKRGQSYRQQMLRQYERLLRRARRLGADGVYMAHNHPSGVVTPSQDDLELTGQFAGGMFFAKRGPAIDRRFYALRRIFKGHIIIDHDQYTLLEWDNGAVSYATYPLDPQFVLPANPIGMGGWIGQANSNPTTTANIIRSVQQDPGRLILLYNDQKMRVGAIQDAPAGLLNDYDNALGYLRGQARKFGAPQIFVAGDVNALSSEQRHTLLQLVGNARILGRVDIPTGAVDVNPMVVGHLWKDAEVRGRVVQEDAGGLNDKPKPEALELEIAVNRVSDKEPKQPFTNAETLARHNARAIIKQILWDAGHFNDNVVRALDGTPSKSDKLDIEEALASVGDKRLYQEIYEEQIDLIDGDVANGYVEEFDPGTDDVFDFAEKAVGTTEDPREAGYVLPDGTMLDLSGTRQGGDGGGRYMDHREVIGLLPLQTDMDSTEGMVAFQRMGAMRVDYNAGMVDLETAPSAAQERFIRDMMEGREESVYIDLADNDRRAHIEPESGRSTKALGQIRRFYRGEDIPSGPMYSTSTGRLRDRAPRGIAVEAAEKAVARLRRRWRNGPKNFHVVESAEEIPERFRAPNMRGVYIPATDTVYVVGGMVDSPEQAVFVAMHEVVGHRGVEAILGQGRVDQFYERLASARARDIRKTGRAFETRTDKIVAAKEWFADRIGRGELGDARKWWDRLIELLKAALNRILGRDTARVAPFGEDGLQALARAAHGYSQAGVRRLEAGGRGTSPSVPGSPTSESRRFRRGKGDEASAREELSSQPQPLYSTVGMSGEQVQSLMRQHNVTISELAKRMQVTQKHIRQVRERGLTNPNAVRDWVQGITGVDPGPQPLYSTVGPGGEEQNRQPSPDAVKAFTDAFEWAKGASLDLLAAYRKKDVNAKEDLRRLDTLLRTIQHYSERVPALRRVYEAALRLRDDKHLLENTLFEDGNGHSWLAQLRDFEKSDRAEYAKLNEYLWEKDRSGEGYIVRQEPDPDKDGATIWSVYAGKKSVRTGFTSEDEAWQAAYLKEASELPMSDAAQQALLAIRNINHNQYLMLKDAADDVRRSYAEAGKELPRVTMNGEVLDLFQALRQMGDRRGHYMPRLRNSGGYLLWANKDGENPVLETFDTHTLRAVRATKLQRDGYKVTYSISNRPSEEVFIEGNVTAMNDMIQNALAQQRRSEVRGQDFESFGVKTGRYDYTRKTDGETERHLIVQAPDTKEMTQIMMNLGGHRYDDGQTGTGEAWHWAHPERGMETRVLWALRHSELAANQTEIFGKALMTQLAEIIHSRGSRSRKIGRSEAVGDEVYVGYEEEAIRSVTRAGKATAGGTAKRIMAQRMMSAITGTDITWEDFKRKEAPNYENLDRDAKRDLWNQYQGIVEESRIDSAVQPRAYRDATEFMKDMLRNEEEAERLFGVVKGLASFKYLSGVAPGLVNLTALGTTVPAAMKGFGDIPLAQSPQLIVRGTTNYTNFWLYHKWGKGEAPAADDQWLFEEIRRRGWDEAQYNMEAVQVLQNALDRNWQKLIDYSLIAFGVTERLNRGGTIAAAYYGLRKQDPQGDRYAQLEKAKYIADKAHAVYGKANLPAWARGSGYAAQTMRAWYMYKNFAHNYLQVLAELGMKKDAGAFAWQLLSPAIVGGAGATIATPILAGIVKAVLRAVPGVEPPDDPEEWLYGKLREWFGWPAERLARSGLVGLFGPNIKGSLQIGIADVAPQTLGELFGAPAGIVRDYGQAIEAAGGGDWVFALEKASPRLIAGPVRAYREASRGVTTGDYHPRFYGPEQIRPNTWATVQRAMGLNPASVSEKVEEQWSEYQVKQTYDASKADIYARIRYYRLENPEPDPDVWMELMGEVEAWNARAERQGHFASGMLSPITDDSIRAVLRNASEPRKSERLRDSDVPVAVPLLTVQPEEPAPGGRGRRPGRNRPGRTRPR